MIDEAEMRAAIVAEALKWELTPYHAGARVLGVGVDCIQLPCAVYHAVGLIPALDHLTYSEQHMLHCKEGDELYLGEIRKWTREISIEDIQPGDLILWRFGRVYSHSAIVLEPPIVLHAVLRAGRVVRGDMNAEEDLLGRRRKAFTLFGKERR